MRVPPIGRRAILGISALWSAAAAALGLGFYLLLVAVHPEELGASEGLSVALPILAMAGLVAGLAFAALLALFERGRPLAKVASVRAAGWGALAGALAPLLLRTDASMAWVTGVVGAALGLISVGIARRRCKAGVVRGVAV
jgi:hypothetical protein